MPRRRRTERTNTRKTAHPYGEVIVIDDEVPPPLPPLIVIDDYNVASTEVAVEAPAEDSVEAPVKSPAEDLVETPAEDLVETPAEDLVETPAEDLVETPAEDLVETSVEDPVEAPAETPTECVICQEGGTLVDSNCHECHVKVHQNCLDNRLFPRLNEPTCPHCRTVIILSSLEIDGIR